MSESPKNLGKLVSAHGTSPVFLQRAALVAVVSFVFFLAMLLAFYLRQQLGYFVLSTAFLVVYLFTMIGWWMQKRNVVSIYQNGISYRKFRAGWKEISTSESDNGFVLTSSDGDTATLPATIHGIGEIRRVISSKIAD